MSETIRDTIPLVLRNWIADEKRELAQLSSVHVEAELRIKTQEEMNFSRYRGYAETGLYDVTLTFADNSTLHKRFTREELIANAQINQTQTPY